VTSHDWSIFDGQTLKPEKQRRVSSDVWYCMARPPDGNDSRLDADGRDRTSGHGSSRCAVAS